VRAQTLKQRGALAHKLTTFLPIPVLYF
jgi:hypothetical protein